MGKNQTIDSNNFMREICASDLINNPFPFLQAVPNRTRETLVGCIKANILPGTTIISDCWKAYNGIEEIEGYKFKHLTVNHSENFVDPHT